MRRTAWIVAMVLLVVGTGCSDDGSDGAGGGSGGAAVTSTTTSTSRPAPDGCDADLEIRPGVERLTIPAGGIDREVERVVPPSYDGTTPHPLLLNLHGASSTIEQQNLFSGLPEAAAERGYVLLTPQAAPATLSLDRGDLRAPYWNLSLDGASDLPGAQDDVAFLTALVDDASTGLCIDPSRIYATGNSNGGGMAATLACALPGRLAAIAPVSGINLAEPCPDLDPVSVVAFHGDADPLVPYADAPDGGDRPADARTRTSVEARVGDFARAGGCEAEPEVSAPHDDVTHRSWTACEPGVDVELHTVLGGGHTWPGMLNYVDAGRLAELGGDQELVELAGLDLAAVAGHMTVNLEATTVMLDFFEALPRRS